jgi:Fe2+ or Zn2+ uptake regulation protein
MRFAVQAEEALRRGGRRITPVRRALLLLLEDETPRAPRELHRELRRRGVRVDRVSVYRNVATLLSLGLVHRVLGSAAVRPCAQRKPACHHAIVCTGCGVAREFRSGAVEKALAALRVRPPGFVVHGHLLELRGLCQRCAA